MKIARGKHGFSLIELLTVIAIIAILAAIIFPVMTAVKNNARRTQCITNLHDIAVGLGMYKNDNRRYPETLAGYVQKNPPITGTVIPFERTRGDALYPEYVKSVRGFHCPLSQITDTTSITTIPSSPEPFYYYSYDSYDVYSPNLGGGEGVIEDLRYTLLWAAAETDVDSLTPFPPGTLGDQDLIQSDYKRQLRFRQPSDDTVVTWCSYHIKVSDPKSMVPVLFLDGHVDLIPGTIIEGGSGSPGCRWRAMPKKTT